MEDRNEEVTATTDDLESIINEHWDAQDNATESKEETVVETKEEENTTEATEEVVEDKEEEKPDAKPTTTDIKAPQSWNPDVREKFAELPEDVRAEISRRENEMGQKHREAAQYRQYLDSINGMLTPYQDYIEARGGNPLNAMGELLSTAQMLQKGTQQEKARAIAGLFAEFGVDVEELDNALAEVVSRPKPSPTEQALLQKLSALEQKLTPKQQAEQSQAQPEAIGEIEKFAKDPANEFFMDVKDDMAILLQSGRAQTLKDAYNIAVRMNDRVSKAMQDRAKKQSERISAGTISVKGQSPKTQSSKPKGGDDALWDAIVENWGD